MPAAITEFLESLAEEETGRWQRQHIPKMDPYRPEDFKDVLPIIRQGCKDMKKGQMVALPDFSLGEAMSCFEINDPKMDTGMQLLKRPVMKTEELIATDSLPRVSSLPLATRIALMDRLMQLEVLYYQGTSVPLSVLSCRYLHNLEWVQDVPFMAYGRAVLKTCSTMKTMVGAMGVSNEEDFSPATLGLYMCEAMDDASLLKLLSLVDEDLVAKQRLAKGKACEGVTPLQDDPEKEQELCAALLARIRFRKALYQTQQAATKGTRKSMELAARYAKQAIGHLDQVRATHEQLGLGDVELPSVAFEEELSFRLLPAHSFGKQGKVPSVEEAAGVLQEFLEEVVRSVALSHRTCDMLEYLAYFREFSRREPLVLSRCLLWRLFWRNRKVFGEGDIKSITVEALIAWGLAEDEVKDPNTDDLLCGITNLLFQHLHTLCFNRVRQRRRLKYQLEEVGKVQLRASALDKMAGQRAEEEEQEKPRVAFFDFMVVYATEVMHEFLALGFELELYSEHELLSVFWYLAQVSSSQQQAINRRNDAKYELLLYEHEKLVAAAATQATKKKKGGKAKKLAKRVPNRPMPVAADYEREAKECLCRGTLLYLVALKKSGKMPEGEFRFVKPQLHFESRFHYFRYIRTPFPFLYAHYQTNIAADLKAKEEELVAAASKFFKIAAQCLDRAGKMYATAKQDAAHIKPLVKLCITNQVYLARQGDAKPSFDFSLHGMFPIVKTT